jgi:alpha-tubulin suppressor-like RCC1 family protein
MIDMFAAARGSLCALLVFSPVAMSGEGSAHPDLSDREPKRPTGNALATLQPVAIAAGNGHSLVLAADGTVWRWGEHQGLVSVPSYADSALTPVQVGGLSDVVAIAAGWRFSLALLEDGTVRAWGRNPHGQLGDASYVSTETPVTVLAQDGNTTKVLGGIVAIAVGEDHALALQDTGLIWAWGRNDKGQLGVGPSPILPMQTSLDVNLAVPLPTLSNVRSVAAATSYSLAVTHSGEVYRWGWNYPTDDYFPVLIPGLTDVTAVVGGSAHSAALLTDGTVSAWGNDDYGQLGYGTLSDVTAIAAFSGEHTLALLADGTVQGWGRNDVGQLGNADNVRAQKLPVEAKLQRLQLPPLPGTFGVTRIAAGFEHSLALDEACNAVWAWGANYAGQLGNSTRDESNVPTPVTLGGGVFNDTSTTTANSGCYLLGAVKNGNGEGTVSEAGGLISCGRGCSRAYARYARPVVGPSTVTLTAAARQGSRFTGWGEACAAAGAGMTATINVTRSTLCTATFETEVASD